MIDHDMMTMEQARARIRELAAERDAAIDARLTAERALHQRIADLEADRAALEKERDALYVQHSLAEESRALVVSCAHDALKEHGHPRHDVYGAAYALGWLSARLREAKAAQEASARTEAREAYVLRRTAALLESTGYTTVERAAAEARRELAVVLGGGS